MKLAQAVAPLIAVLACCSTPRSRIPELARIYEKAALDEVRNPVIVIHGILGSRLMQRSTGKVVWGAFTSESIDPETPDGARALGLPLRSPGPAASYEMDEEDVHATGPLGKLELSLFYTLISVNVYADIIRTLGAGGYADRATVDPTEPRYADDHYTCFSFFYDWRRDNVANAIQLGRFIEEKRVEVERSARAKIGRLRAGDDAERREADRIDRWLARGFRFDIVAHSMGGLIAHYYLRYGMVDLPTDGSLPELTWAGAAHVDRLVVVGTPNFGSMEALENLTQGYQPAFILPFFDPAILGSMPSIYQLLPRVRHGLTIDRFGSPIAVEFLDPRVWDENGWGLLAPRSARVLQWLLPGVDDADARRRIAGEYLAWCLARARQLHAALDVAPSSPCPARLHLFAADAEPTLHRARLVATEDGRLVPQFEGTGLRGAGDGTVMRYSALGDDREGTTERQRLVSPIPWSSVTFLSDDHIGLTRNPHFSDNMLFLLLDAPLHRPPPRTIER